VNIEKDEGNGQAEKQTRRYRKTEREARTIGKKRREKRTTIEG
jgi:hypothetical protein